MNSLNRTTANKPVKHPVKVMQFGGGNFLRAFCDWMFDVLNKTTDEKSEHCHADDPDGSGIICTGKGKRGRKEIRGEDLRIC